MFFHVIHIRLHLEIDSKLKSSFWIIIVNTRIEESQIVLCILFYFQLQKAKDDTEEAYNSISEAAKKH